MSLDGLSPTHRVCDVAGTVRAVITRLARTCGAMLIAAGCLIASACAGDRGLPPSNSGAAVFDGGERFGGNLDAVRTGVEQFSSATAMTATVLSVRRDSGGCAFGQNTATRWGRTNGAFVVIVLGGVRDDRGEVCLNSAARAAVTAEGGDVRATVKVFEKLVEQHRWATAVSTVLKGLAPRRAALVPFPDRTVEDAQVSVRAEHQRDDVTAYVIIIGLPLVAISGWASAVLLHRRRSQTGPHRSP